MVRLLVPDPKRVEEAEEIWTEARVISEGAPPTAKQVRQAKAKPWCALPSAAETDLSGKPAPLLGFRRLLDQPCSPQDSTFCGVAMSPTKTKRRSSSVPSALGTLIALRRGRLS